MIRIPVKTHLFKYLQAHINQEKVHIKTPTQLEIFESPQLRLQKVIGHCINPMLRCDGGFKLEDIKYKNYNIMLFVPSDSMIKRGRMYLSIQAVHRLNDLLRTEMMSELGMMVDKAISEKRRIDLTILDFMNQYNIDEEDIRFDSLKKSLYRERLVFAPPIENNKDEHIGYVDLTYHSKMIATHR